MKYQNSDSINGLNFSTRSHNALMRAGISSVGDLLSKSKEDIKKIRQIGAKSIEEITDVIDEVKSINLDICSGSKDDIDIAKKNFIGNDGQKYIDIEIEKLNFSTRAYKCLESVGIKYYSQLLEMLIGELISIPNKLFRAGHP